MKQELKPELLSLLNDNILSYWSNTIDHKNGGFLGRITGNEEVITGADKGAILNARILWTFSSAYRLIGNKKYLDLATRAKDYLLKYFYDNKYGGIYWSVSSLGEPVDTKKQIYALGFAIYGLSEYYRCCEDEDALRYACEIYSVIEQYSFDRVKNGYFEAFTRDWQPIGDMRLSEKDANESKTMNTHLHILEAYTNLYRVWKDVNLKGQLKNLIEIFLDKIINKDTYHLDLFFDDDWNTNYSICSYGHDIEASWLIEEAAVVLADSNLLKRVRAVVPLIVKASEEGYSAESGVIYEKDNKTGHTDGDRHWWVQAEAMVGFYNLYETDKKIDTLQKSISVYDFIKGNMIDSVNGEWFWSIKADNTINRVDDKAGFWKCPYHNGRMCMEIIKRLEKDELKTI